MGVPALLRATVDVGMEVVEQWCHSDRVFASLAARSSGHLLSSLAVKRRKEHFPIR